MTAKKRSEKRQRTVALAGRFSHEEAAQVRNKAQAYGGVSALIRHLTLQTPAPRHSTDRKAVARLLAELGKIRAELGKSGSNLNQLAHYANMDRYLTGSVGSAIEEHEQAIRTREELRLACMQGLGFERSRKPPEED